MSLSDLGSRVERALKLADPSDEWPGAPRAYVHSKSVESLHHFVTVVSEYHSGSKASVEVMRKDMVRVAFTVCIEAVLAFVFCPP
jgi:hypothetical protein